MRVLCSLFLSLLPMRAWAGSLDNLYHASCDLYALANAEYVTCRDFPATCPGELGAYARNGGATSKLAKMCNFRVLDMIGHCAALNYTAAHTDVVNAESAMENWDGQTITYIRNGQLPVSYGVVYIGLGVTSSDILDPPTTTMAKNGVWALAENAGIQDPILAVANSILADLKNRLDRPTVCDGD